MNLSVWIPVIITAVVVLAFAILLFIRNMKANYDERQLMARNTAYKFSFFFHKIISVNVLLYIIYHTISSEKLQQQTCNI